jgi:hypothetical protein
MDWIFHHWLAHPATSCQVGEAGWDWHESADASQHARMCADSQLALMRRRSRLGDLLSSDGLTGVHSRRSLRPAAAGRGSLAASSLSAAAAARLLLHGDCLAMMASASSGGRPGLPSCLVSCSCSGPHCCCTVTAWL